MYSSQSENELKSLAKVEQQAINATREKLSGEKLPEKPKVKFSTKGIDVQDEFVKEDEEKIKKIQDREIEKMRMQEENLSEYQARRVRALTKIMNEVIAEGPDPKKDKRRGENIAELFGLDQVYDKSKLFQILF